MKMKKIAAVFAALVLTVCAAGCSGTPQATFMYFVSGSDSGFEETNAMLEELKDEYKKKIKFDVVNIDENPEATENFPVSGNTPALIMLDENNDISAIEFKCNNKEKLVKDIENAISKN